MAYFDRFLLLSDADCPTALHMTVSDETDQRIKDPFMIIAGYEHPILPLVFVPMMGRKPMDFISTSYTSLILLSDRVICAFMDAGITGWSTYPVNLFDRHRHEIEGYNGLVVTGRSGVIDDTRSMRMLRDPIIDPAVDAGAPYWAWVGLFFDEQNWDGSDIFLPMTDTEPCDLIIVSIRVRDLLVDMKATNIDFEELRKAERLVLKNGEFAAPRDPSWEVRRHLTE